MNSLGVMQQYGVQIALVILLATIILLGATGLFSQLILSVSQKRQKETPADKQTVRRSNQENELVQH